jgi:hypothetical protein
MVRYCVAARDATSRKWVLFGQRFGSRSLLLVSKGKLYSTLVLNLLLYGSQELLLCQLSADG